MQTVTPLLGLTINLRTWLILGRTSEHITQKNDSHSGSKVQNHAAKIATPGANEEGQQEAFLLGQQPSNQAQTTPLTNSAISSQKPE